MRKNRKSFVLLLGETGALLLPPFEMDSSGAIYAKSHDDDDVAPLLLRLSAAPQLPVICLIDTQGQQYKREELPRLSFFDKRKLAQKRLESAFGAIELKTARVAKDNNALLVALDQGGVFARWKERLANLANETGLVGLLPLECAGMVGALSDGAAQGWSLLLIAHETGGLRQIVTKDGAFIFTRLTPPLAPTSSEGFRAATLALDIKATRDYLARFGLTAETPLHMAAILPRKMHETLRATPIDVTSRHFYTPHEAITRLNLPCGPSQEIEMGDLVALLWFASQTRFQAPLMTEEEREKQHQETVRKKGFKAAACLALLALFITLAHGLTLLKTQRDVSTLQNEVSGLESDFKLLQNQKTDATEPLERLRQAAERQRFFAPAPSQLMELLQKLAPIFEGQATAQELDWLNGTLNLTLRLLQPEDPTQQYESLLKKMRESLPNAHIERQSASEEPLANAPLSNQTDKTDAPDQALAHFTIREAP